MALSDVLKPKSKEQIISELKELDSEQLKIEFTKAFYKQNLSGLKLIFIHTNIAQDHEFIHSFVDEINKLNQIITLFGEHNALNE